MDLMFDRFEISKVLVIGPLRVCSTVWPEERMKWDGLTTITYFPLTNDDLYTIEILW